MHTYICTHKCPEGKPLFCSGHSHLQKALLMVSSSATNSNTNYSVLPFYLSFAVLFSLCFTLSLQPGGSLQYLNRIGRAEMVESTECVVRHEKRCKVSLPFLASSKRTQVQVVIHLVRQAGRKSQEDPGGCYIRFLKKEKRCVRCHGTNKKTYSSIIFSGLSFQE